MNDSVRAMTDETMTLAEKFQKECHEIVEATMKELPSCTYQDATNIFFFNKLAELQIQINKLNTLQ